MPQRNFLILLVAAAISFACYVRGDQDPYRRYVAGGLAAIHDEGLDPVPSRELFNGAMQGMVEVLRRRGDEHSQFLDEAAANPLRNEIHQQFGGIGARIGFEGKPPRLAIVGVPDPGTPAARAKLQPGDLILSIDDKPTTGVDMLDLLSRMRGDPGTKVRLTIERAGEPQPRTVELVRDVIQIDSVLGDRRAADGSWQFRLENEPRIALIRIASFGERTATEFSRVMQKVMQEGVRAIVLDLRDNAGGSLDSAVAVCQMLLPAGKTIVQTRRRDQIVQQRYETTRDGPYLDLPVAVVVNQKSASAAEIVAACLQDDGRAVVVGERTYGKGTVQQLVPLESGKSLLRLTWASFWRPSGANIHRAIGAPADAIWGVRPDDGYERSLSPDEYAAYEHYREARDAFGQADASADSASDITAQTAGFIDEPLQLAVGYLRGKLGDKP